ncbi:MAG: TM0106 family RecB-like putative nuclease, partial [Candidatus Baltobacteraceae bacterium]
MQRIDGRFIYSASDLNNFLECEHLSGLDRRAALREIERPPADNPQAEILAELGEAHERSYLRRLQDSGKHVVTIERGSSNADHATAAQATAGAMRAGAAIIYQACFFDNAWLGYADFLRRIEVPSELGSWSYEVADTKLARHTEPYFILQLCFYSECVGAIQGRPPAQMHVILGHGVEESFRVKDYSAYYRATKARFLKRISGDAPTYPYPTKHCDFCVWDTQCTQKRVADDHLSLVAGMRRLQTARLTNAGITTLEALSKSTAEQRPAKMNLTTYEKLARQARLQFEQRVALAAKELNPYKYEILPIDPGSFDKGGFALIPPPNSGDVFFDMEGYPFYGLGEIGAESGLEYLFGAYTGDDKRFTAFWGCDRAARPAGKDRLAERRAFERFIDWVMERRRTFPDLHIYHYASYEKTALQKLAQRHGTREEEVDTILRDELLIDLYRVVKQTICVGQPGYGIKKLE